MITVLTGGNSFLIAEELKRFEAEFSGEAERFEGEEVTREQLPDLLMGATLFASERLVIIHQMAANKTVYSELENYLENLSDSTHLVLVEPQLDRRTRVYKWLQKNANIIDCRVLSEREINSWLGNYARQLDIELSDDVRRLLISRVGTDQWSLSRAVQKLALSPQAITAEVVTNLIEATPQATAFELLDAIINQRRDQTSRLLDDVKQTEDAYKFFGLFSSQLFTLGALRVADGVPIKQVASDLAVHPFVVEKLQPAARRIDGETMSQMIEALVDADIKIKSTGAKPWQVIETAIGRMLK